MPDQTPTPTRFLKNCEEVGLFNELASSFEQDDEDKKAKNSVRRAARSVSSTHHYVKKHFHTVINDF